MAFQKGQPRPENAGRKAGSKNKIAADVKTMLEAALTRAGGEDYLLTQAIENPKAFLSLLGRIIPLQVTGKDGRDLLAAPDPSKIALALLGIIEDARSK